MKYQGKMYVTKSMMESGLMFSEIKDMLEKFEQGTLDSFTALRYSQLIQEIMEMKNREK